MNMLVYNDFEQNTIYLCSLVPSIGDNLHTIAIINDWILKIQQSNQIGTKSFR